MSFASRTHVWGANEVLTSSQMNNVDIDRGNAVDKTTAGDTVSGLLQMSSAGRVVPTIAIGANADHTYLAAGGNTFIRVTSATTANHIYTLSAFGAVDGDPITISCDPSFLFEIQVKDQAGVVMYTLGNSVLAGTAGTPDGKSASFIYSASGWHLQHGAQNLDWAQTLPALNWGAVSSIGVATLTIGWSDIEQAWYAIRFGSTTNYRSADYGKAWSTTTLNVAPTAGADVAFDAAGNAVIVGLGATNVQDGTYVSYNSITWANHAGQVSSYVGAVNVVYEPTNNLWCILGSISGSGSTAFTSANRTSWTSRTIPATWNTYAVDGYPFVGAGNGLVVAAFTSIVGAAGTFRTMRSADGGATWSNDQAIVVNAGINIAGGATSLTRPVWSAVDGRWYIAVNQISGTNRVQVFSSPDAITWTSVALYTANDCEFSGGLVCLGSILVGIAADGRTYASWNKGANWFRCGSCGLAAPAIARAGGNGLMILASSTTVASARFGLPATAV